MAVRIRNIHLTEFEPPHPSQPHRATTVGRGTACPGSGAAGAGGLPGRRWDRPLHLHPHGGGLPGAQGAGVPLPVPAARSGLRPRPRRRSKHTGGTHQPNVSQDSPRADNGGGSQPNPRAPRQGLRGGVKPRIQSRNAPTLPPGVASSTLPPFTRASCGGRGRGPSGSPDRPYWSGSIPHRPRSARAVRVKAPISVLDGSHRGGGRGGGGSECMPWGSRSLCSLHTHAAF